MKNNTFRFLMWVFLLTGMVPTTTAQVPLTTVVEHFTNTNCSVCASRNPGFYNNLRNQSNVLYLSIHPSSPYASCLLSQQNTIDNDARTNYYGVYGATPRLVINGTAINPNQNYAAASLFAPFTGQSSAVELRATQTAISADSVSSTIVVRRVASSANASVSLFVGLVEDTVNYTGGNGEPQHFNVLRKALYGASGISVSVPASVGDSIVITATTAYKSFWNKNRMRTVAILQETASHAVVQSCISASSTTTTAIQETSGIQLTRIANPIGNSFTIENPSTKSMRINLYDSVGKCIYSNTIEGVQQIDCSALENGLYILEQIINNTRSSQQLIVLHP